MAILGVFVDEKELSRRAGSTRNGTDEKMLKRAAKSYKCELLEVRKYDEDAAYKAITGYLAKNIPCLICINQWAHWVTIVGFDARRARFVVIDSEKNPVVRLPSWNELKRRWPYNEHDKDGALQQFYDFYPLKAKFRVRTKANFSLQRAQVLRRQGNANFVAHFDEYVTDMLDIARPEHPSVNRGISMAEFLRRHRKMLVDTVSYWNDSVSQAKLKRVLSNLQFVAETYGLIVPEEEEKRTIAALAALLTTWATSHEPVEALYGE